MLGTRLLWLCVGGCLATSLCVSGEVRADGTAEPIRVEYTAAPGCPSGADFLRAVLARTSRVRRAASGEQARTFQVNIHETDAGKLSGEFSIAEPQEPEQASDKRAITGDSCREVFDALSLFAALSVDPEALTTPVEPVESVEPAPAPLAHRTTQAAPRVSASAPSSPEKTRFHAAVGVDVGALTAGTGTALLLSEPFLEASMAPARASRVSLAPTLRLAFSTVGTDTQTTSDGRAHLHWTTLRLDGCPAELEMARSFLVRPCVAFGAGVLEASGKTIAHPESHTLGWETIGALFRLEWTPWRFLSFEASAGVDAPLRRDTFYFEPFQPSTVAYQAPLALTRASFGVGLHFL